MKKKTGFNVKCSWFPVCGLCLLLLAGCGHSQPSSEISNTSEAPEISEISEASETPEMSESSELSENSEEAESVIPEQTEAENSGEEDSEMKMNVQVGDSVFTAVLEENEAVDALVEMMEDGPVTIQMSDYAGFEKVGSLGTSLPASNSQTTTRAGDIVLYQGNQIVMFYGSNSWSYTRLGHIEDLTGWEEALGNGDVTAVFSLE